MNYIEDTQQDNTPQYIQSLGQYEEDWIKGNFLDVEFMTTEDKILFRNLSIEYGII